MNKLGEDYLLIAISMFSYKNMILVFGKTSQIGRELQKLGETVLLNRTQADLTDTADCKKVIDNYRPIAVINTAAYTAVDMAEKEEDLANLINGEAPKAMAEACANLNIPLVHISTDYVFDGSGKNAWQNSGKTNPQNAYGRSKLKGEKAIIKSNCNYGILRTSWVVSAHGNNFVKTMLNLSKTRDILNVVDDQIGGPTCARDIAKACIIIAKQLINEPEKSGIYHYSGMPNVSWCEFANSIFEQAGKRTIAKPILTSQYPKSVSRPLNSRLECNLTKKTFNISRPFWRNGLKDILRDLGINDETT